MVGITRKRPSASVGEDEEQSDASSPGSTGSKRARYDRDASVESDDRAGPNGFHNPARVRDDVHPEDDEYSEEPFQPGSIVRVTLTNFVTYTAAEFHPGPSLNMVIGPNGTGKSTLVCAICLGLGWDPRNLGRAKEIGEFVKHGSTEAVIEIELAAAEQQRTNPVIRRMIRKEGNKSAFFINGRPSTQKEVVKLAKSFSIQIDNLCQFLPQDRVVEFAALQPVALLKETLRAAAPNEMVVWHEDLIKLRGEEKRLETELKNETAALKHLEDKQNSTREDVERFQRRQDLVTKASALQKCRPVIESNVLKKQILNIKDERQAARQQLRQLNADAAPARAAQLDMEAYRNQILEIRNQRKVHVDKAQQRADKLAADIKSGNDSVAEVENKIKAEYEAQKQRKQERARLETKIASIERDMRNEPVDVDEDSYKRQRQELQDKRLDVLSRLRDVQDQTQAIKDKAREMKTDVQNKVNERAQLDTQSGQQASLLQSVSRDTATGWAWIEKNRDQLQLKGEIYGPPILTCSVTDPRYADIVESQFGGQGDATAITFTNGDDQREISNKLLGKGRDGLGLHQITLRLASQPLAFYRAPVTRDELRALGFDGWILDFVKGPEPVLAMLCDSAQLHRAAYTPTRLSTEQHLAVEQSAIPTWIAGRDKYRVNKRREYGVSSTRVTSVNKARFFTEQPVDDERKRQLDDEVERLKQKMDEAGAQYRNFVTEEKQLKQQRDEAESEIKAIDEDHRRQRKARAQWEALPGQKEEKEVELGDLRNLANSCVRRILNLKAESQKIAFKIASLAIEYQKAVSILRHVHENLVEAEIRLVEANSEVESLQAENIEITRARDALESKIKELDKEKQTLANEYRKLISQAQRILNGLSDEENAYVREFSQLETTAQLHTEIDAVNARLALMADGDPHAVTAFENRKREIERKENILTKIGDDLEDTRAKITEIRGSWEPRLDELVDTISEGFAHNFAKIGCAGLVGVHKDEDFDKWSIQIQVRFRETENLSILDSQRQSGGERAVSTVFYLMALQDLARSPFRVVDEINQGMDPRNERMVHERMVDIACRERTSQYFLITPKLLNDLKFHPKMKIHCIASGEHMPDQHQKLDFQKLADIAIRRKVGAAA